MADNPLLTGQSARPGKVTAEMLDNLAASLNRTRWVDDSRKPYFVNERTEPGGKIVRFLDRK